MKIVLMLAVVLSSLVATNSYARCVEGAVVYQDGYDQSNDAIKIRRVCVNGFWTPPGAPVIKKCKEGSSALFGERDRNNQQTFVIRVCRNGKFYGEFNKYPAVKTCRNGATYMDYVRNSNNETVAVLRTCRNGKWR